MLCGYIHRVRIKGFNIIPFCIPLYWIYLDAHCAHACVWVSGHASASAGGSANSVGRVGTNTVNLFVKSSRPAKRVAVKFKLVRALCPSNTPVWQREQPPANSFFCPLVCCFISTAWGQKNKFANCCSLCQSRCMGEGQRRARELKTKARLVASFQAKASDHHEVFTI